MKATGSVRVNGHRVVGMVHMTEQDKMAALTIMLSTAIHDHVNTMIVGETGDDVPFAHLTAIVKLILKALNAAEITLLIPVEPAQIIREYYDEIIKDDNKEVINAFNIVKELF